MANMLKDFGETAERLARNPLGILALFQVLIYGIAGYVTAQVDTTNPSLLTPLIWFLVIFPVIVLGLFTYLVAVHHSKLYAPSDYTDEENFMRSAGVQPRFTAQETKKLEPLPDVLPKNGQTEGENNEHISPNCG